MDKKKRAMPIIKSQKEILIEFMTKHPELRSGRFSASFTFKKAKDLWNELTDILNSIPNGSQKDWKQWRKTWQDYKKNIKSKGAQSKYYSSQTGGGPPNPENFDPEENQVLDLLSKTEVEGINNVVESEVQFLFTNDEDTPCLWSEKENLIPQTDSDLAIPENVEISGSLKDKNELSQDDHTYNINHPSPQSSRMKRSPQKLSKTRRLENSLKLSQGLLKSVTKKDEILENYYKKKIEYLEHKQRHDLQLLEIHKENLEINKNILQTLKSICNDHIQKK